MQLINLGILSDDVHRAEKFILLEDKRLFLGTVLYHKELAVHFFTNQDVKVIAAGTIPKEEVNSIEKWGWKSTGYNVVTDVTLRPLIFKEILRHKEKNEL